MDKTIILRAFCTALFVVMLFGCVNSGKKYPKAKPHYTLGLSYLQSENPTLALREFLQALERSPRDADIHAGLALAYQYKKAYALSEQHYLKALNYSDDEPRYQNDLGALYLTMERWDDAISFFDKASKNLLFMRTELSYMGKGYAYYRKGDYPAALQAYSEAEAISPRLATLHFYRGETFQATGRLDLARASYGKALSYIPNYSEARYQLAVLDLKEKRLTQAKTHLKAIVDQDPLSTWGIKSADFLKTMK